MLYLVSHPIYLSFKYCHEKPSAQTHALTVVDAITEQCCDCGIHSTSALYQHISEKNQFKSFLSTYFLYIWIFCSFKLQFCSFELFPYPFELFYGSKVPIPLAEVQTTNSLKDQQFKQNSINQTEHMSQCLVF